MGKVLTLAALMAFALKVQAQDADTTWKKGGAVGATFSQVALKNWSGGGDNALALNGLVSLFANYHFEKTTWDNSLELAYGVVRLGDQGTRKADDKIIFVSKYGRDLVGQWQYSALFDLRTQFAPGFDYNSKPKARTSEFMAPGYITLALGANYRPSDNFSALISPITGKATIVLDKSLSNAGAFGVDSGKTIRTEFGWFINSQYKRAVMEGIDFESKLNLFSSYDDLKNIDVNWESTFLMKVNKYISANFSVTTLYDNDIKDPKSGKAKWQVKEIFAAGLLYKF